MGDLEQDEARSDREVERPSDYFIKVARRRRSVRAFYSLVVAVSLGMLIYFLAIGDGLPWFAYTTTGLFVLLGVNDGWRIPRQVDRWVARNGDASFAAPDQHRPS